MTWTGAYGSGSADLTATPDGTDEWTVTSLTGTQDGLPISLATVAYGDADDDIFQPPNYNYLVDRSGLAFTDGTNDYNIFQDNGSTPAQECSSAVNGPCVGGYADDAPTLTSFTITPGISTVPEPTSAGLVGIMVLGVALAIRRKYRVA